MGNHCFESVTIVLANSDAFVTRVERTPPKRALQKRGQEMRFNGFPIHIKFLGFSFISGIESESRLCYLN